MNIILSVTTRDNQINLAETMPLENLLNNISLYIGLLMSSYVMLIKKKVMGLVV